MVIAVMDAALMVAKTNANPIMCSSSSLCEISSVGSCVNSVAAVPMSAAFMVFRVAVVLYLNISAILLCCLWLSAWSLVSSLRCLSTMRVSALCIAAISKACWSVCCLSYRLFCATSSSAFSSFASWSSYFLYFASCAMSSSMSFSVIRRAWVVCVK